MRASDSARRDPVLLLAIGASLLAIGAAAAVSEHLNPIAMRHYVTWRGADEARAIAIEQRRPILYAFLEQRDATSLQIERDLFADAELGPRLNREFILVRSDPKFAAQYGVGGGALVVTDPEGARHQTLGGYRGRAYAEQFLFMAAKSLRGEAPADDATRPFVEALSRIGSAHSPSFSPDAARIAFIADLSGEPQLWMTDVHGSYPQLIASMEHGIDAAQWSPDGQWIAFASDRQTYVVRPDGSGIKRLTSAGSARNIMSAWTRDSLLPINAAFKSSPSMESALFDPNGGTARVIAKSPNFGVIVDVACDGRSAVILQREGAKRSTSIVGEGARKLADDQTLATFDCANSTLFAVTNANRDRTAFVRIRGDVFETLWQRDDAELSQAAITDDRRLAALTWNRAGQQELALLDLRSGARATIDLPLTSIGELRFSRDGKQLVFTGSGAQAPPDIWLLDVATRRARRITRSSHPGVDLDQLVRPELIHFQGADGLPLTGWLYRAKSGSAAVISLHGGPMQQETPSMNATYQALVAGGISVFAPNVRGSLGFGKRFMSLDDGPLRVNAINDVKAAADWLVQNGVAKKLGVMGESYGGWLALETATRYPSLFAAIADSYGMLDLEAMIDQAGPEVAPMLRAEYGSDLGELSVDIDDLNIPTLVLHGSRDVIVRPEHSTRLVRELRARKVPVEYILFENEGHGFHEETSRVRAAAAIVNFFTKSL
jgi:dipeptidyl aminopeptidase/acylaminoacyl peptidase